MAVAGEVFALVGAFAVQGLLGPLAPFCGRVFFHGCGSGCRSPGVGAALLLGEGENPRGRGGEG